MVEDLVEELRRLEPAAECLRHSRDRGLEDVDEPAICGDGLGNRSAARRLELRAVAGDVAEQAPRLILLDLEARERLQRAHMVTWLDDAGLQAKPVLAVMSDHLNLIHVEAEPVETLEAFLDPVTLIRREIHL